MYHMNLGLTVNDKNGNTCTKKVINATCIAIYPAMTAFTDQYSLPNIFFDIGQL